jgi:hypothetical protein
VVTAPPGTLPLVQPATRAAVDEPNLDPSTLEAYVVVVHGTRPSCSSVGLMVEASKGVVSTYACLSLCGVVT